MAILLEISFDAQFKFEIFFFIISLSTITPPS